MRAVNASRKVNMVDGSERAGQMPLKTFEGRTAMQAKQNARERLLATQAVNLCCFDGVSLHDCTHGCRSTGLRVPAESRRQAYSTRLKGALWITSNQQQGRCGPDQGCRTLSYGADGRTNANVTLRPFIAMSVIAIVNVLANCGLSHACEHLCVDR
jgi:hypothetical protein